MRIYCPDQTTSLLAALFLILCVVAPLQAQRHNAELVFNLTDPQEAARWKPFSHDENQGSAGWNEGNYVISSGPDAPAYMERPVQINAADYNLLIVDLYVEGEGVNGGFVGTAFFFSNTNLIIPETRLVRNAPVGVRSQLVFRLDQSVFWEGPIRTIRLDPLWGVGTARVLSVKLDKEPPPSHAPSWNFLQENGHLGWTIGEFGVENPTFIARPITQSIDGISFQTAGPNAVIQHFDVKLNADFIKSFEVVLRNETGTPTISRFYWADPTNMAAIDSKSMQLEVSDSREWQRLVFNLHDHPAWRGQIGFILLNPVLAPGRVTIRGIRFNPVEGLGDRGEQDALVQWRTHREVGQDLEGGNYKPLLVLITKNGNAFSSKIENELAANHDFLSLVRNFHAVRLQLDDPATDRVFRDIYRIPVLATMKYDFDVKQWRIVSRLDGPEVSNNCLEVLQGTIQ